MRKIVTSKALLVPLGVSAAAIGIGIWLASRLSSDTWSLVLGLSIGLIIGIPVGMVSIMLAMRRVQAPLSSSLPSPTQQPGIFTLPVERQHLPNPDSSPPPRTSRQFSAVGGADVQVDSTDGDTSPYSS